MRAFLFDRDAVCYAVWYVVQEQSFDQKFESSNKALLISCQKGLPLRVVRSHKVWRPPHACSDLQLGV